jgi:uncharacterized pyridoxamine 5'-phosphate oxidase family protein
MGKPVLKPIPAADLVRLSQEVIKGARFPQLATIDGTQPRVRPVSPVLVEGFTIHVANLRGYHKTVEISANPKVELCYLDDKHNQVRITGRAEVLIDQKLLEQIWAANPLLRNYLGRHRQSRAHHLPHRSRTGAVYAGVGTGVL